MKHSGDITIQRNKPSRMIDRINYEQETTRKRIGYTTGQEYQDRGRQHQTRYLILLVMLHQ